jgi:HPt (histidine-containing phosphotransfer) domain-containing protein
MAPPVKSELSRLTEVLQSISQHWEKSGLRLETSNGVSLGHVASENAQAQKTYLYQLETWLEALQEVLEKRDQLVGQSRGMSLLELEKAQLSSFLKRLGARVDDSLYSEIHDGDVIEVYLFGADGTATQVYRNVAFLQMCSYDLLTLVSHSMQDLFRRPGEIEARMNELIADLFTSTVVKPVDLPAHEITEIRHPRHRKFRIRIRYAAPLFNETGTPIGFVSTLSAEGSGSAFDGASHVQPIR